MLRTRTLALLALPLALAARALPNGGGPVQVGPVQVKRQVPAQPFDRFARSIDASGRFLVGSDPAEESAAVFVRTNWGEWVFSQNVSPGEGEFAGLQVAIDGSTLVLSGEYPDGSGDVAAWVFDGSAHPSWVPQGRLDLPGAPGVGFDTCPVDVSGDTIVLAGRRGNGLAGVARVFVRSGTAWTLEQELTASDASAGSQFGRDCAIDGDTIVIGAPSVDAAYVFVRSGTTWSEEQRLSDPAATDDGAFGIDVAIDGDRIAVGGGFFGGSGSLPGSVWVWDRAGTTWTLNARVEPSDGAAEDSFGQGVSIEGDWLAVGAARDHEPFMDQGSAYLFRYDGAAWCEEAKVTAPDATAADELGETVVLEGGFLFAGAHLADAASQPATQGGQIYAWPFGEEIGTPYCAGGVNSLGLQAELRLFGSADVSDNDVQLVVTDAVPDKSGIFFYGPTQVSFPLGAGTRCVGNVTRTGPLLTTDASGGAYRRLDLTLPPMVQEILNAAPVTMNFQFWYRDAGTTNLTNAVEVAFP